MQIGSLRHRVELQSLSEQNDRGELVRVFVPVATVPAKVKTQRGSEAFEAGRTLARSLLRVLIRYRDDLDTTWRIKWGEQLYNVTAVDDSNRHLGELWFTAEMVGAK